MIERDVRAVDVDENGDTVFDLAADAANADWIRAARLRERADAGDEEALAKLETLFNTSMVEVVR